ncbi:PAS domain-containing hybrid sensor histidine kinase/response regulator [Sphingomonas bisphenolicum]|uniref:histidine kinase n=1 Tax=Sphingomonas bisphenolicum TaxID=296544 RepID=A0ABN5WRG2_9SPHN|nr:PAS domain-containing hybrid sensor histidine kinase/response regulator [Sphingomonas bisphenolicum]BBF72197.1 hybrid sensor histidine kinase/response regulator [Sphingomonas bisphenolicum]
MSIAILLAILYAALLFGGAALAHRYRARLSGSRWRIHAYGLALAVYCTSWTYFGAVGSAATGGWDYLPIYLGPALVMALGGRFLRRLHVEVHRDGATSISDFIGSRFGKSRAIAALVTIILLFGTIPYVALQLRSVAFSFALVSHTPESTAPLIGASAGLALFAILFGARRYQVAGQNEAILFAVATESVLKLVALLLVAGLAGWLLWRIPTAQVGTGIAVFRSGFSPGRLDGDFIVTTLLSMLTIICMPRHFFVSIMEARGVDDILRARWGFIAYLLVTVLAVLPIAAAGLALLGEGSAPDLFVLSLPQHFDFPGLALLVFFGGLSAAMAMVVTEVVAISSMISNDLFAPILLRRATGRAHMGERLLWIRRSAIVALVVAATLYAMATPSTTRLASVGLIAFVAIAQCAPALIFAVYRPHNDAMAGGAGLATGFAIWMGTLFLPAVDLLPNWLDRWNGVNAVTLGTVISLGGNLLAYMFVSARGVSAAALVRQRGIAPIGTMAALGDLVTRFVGSEAVADAFGGQHLEERPIDRSSARAAERLIGSVVGASSARAIMASAISGQGMGFADVAQMLDASGQSLHFSQGLLAATLENIDVGVSVIDRDLRLVAWNSRYLDLFRYEHGMIRVGVPVAELIRFNAERGDCGPGEVEDHVTRRLGHMRSRKPHSFERHRTDGRVIKTVGGAMPDGGYVMSFTDITIEAQARAATETARRDLERAVARRTAQLSDVNAQLAAAMADKTRFLAAASHDLLQPLHAAMLFSAALRRRLDEPEQAMLARLDRSIEAANDLLRALLDISKLDAGGITPQPTRFAARTILVDVVESLRPLAAEKGLSLRVGAGDGWVETDRSLLRSIVQNFVSNAIRYTERGGIVVAARRRGGHMRIEVRDSGIGIAPDKLDIIFREFERLGRGSENGIGLGLAIVERSAALIGAKVGVWSQEGRGSCFAIGLPRIEAVDARPLPPEGAVTRETKCLRLLVVDDDSANRAAMRAALEAMGHTCMTASGYGEALAVTGTLDGALVDFALGDERDGIALIEALRGQRRHLQVALVTAEQGVHMLERARERGIAILAKPLGGAVLDQWIAGLGQDGPGSV